MVEIKKIADSKLTAQVAAARENVKLQSGDSLQNITLQSAMYAVSSFGPFMVLNFVTEEGEELCFFCGESTVWGRNCIKAFADAEVDPETNEVVAYELKAKFVDRPVWIGVGDPVPSQSKKGKTYLPLTWGWMNAKV